MSRCEVCKLPDDLLYRYSEIKFRKLGKETNREKSKDLAKQNFGSHNKRRISAPASKSVIKSNSKDLKIKKGRLELTLDQNKKVVGIRSASASNVPSTGQTSRVGNPRASSGSAGQAQAFVPGDAVGVAFVAPGPVGRSM